MPAETFHPAEYICEELEARGWTVGDLIREAGGNAYDHLALQLYLCNQVPEVVLGDLDRTLANGFGTSRDFWNSLHEAWRAAPELSKPFDVPEAILT